MLRTIRRHRDRLTPRQQLRLFSVWSLRAALDAVVAVVLAMGSVAAAVLPAAAAWMLLVWIPVVGPVLGLLAGGAVAVWLLARMGRACVAHTRHRRQRTARWVHATLAGRLGEEGAGTASAQVATLPLGVGLVPMAEPARSGASTAQWVAAGLSAMLMLLSGFSVTLVKGSRCRAKQSEARTALKAIYVAELAYNGEYGQYLDLQDLTAFGGLDPRTVRGTYYAFSVQRRADGFVALAQDRIHAVAPSGVPDIWRIDDGNPRPERVSDACR